MIDLSELSSNQEANLLTTGLEEWQEEPQVLTFGAILICRRGKATLHINYKDWELHEGAVITVFPNDVVELTVWEADGNPVSPEVPSFQVEMLKYNPSLLREASLQLEQTVYSALREDRCRQDTPCGDKHHQWDVWFIEGIFRPVGMYLHLAAGIVPVEGVLHRFP